MKIKRSSLLMSFRLHLHDKVEHERTIINMIDREIRGAEKIDDANIMASIKKLCIRHGIDFDAVIQHAVSIDNGEENNDKS